MSFYESDNSNLHVIMMTSLKITTFEYDYLRLKIVRNIEFFTQSTQANNYLFK